MTSFKFCLLTLNANVRPVKLQLDQTRLNYATHYFTDDINTWHLPLSLRVAIVYLVVLRDHAPGYVLRSTSEMAIKHAHLPAYKGHVILQIAQVGGAPHEYAEYSWCIPGAKAFLHPNRNQPQ